MTVNSTKICSNCVMDNLFKIIFDENGVCDRNDFKENIAPN